jgi:hypothetical protein|tara:strand:+ start:15 stop:434 length:420 start_codon:yes stop_codon:yes gene_type:complete
MVRKTARRKSRKSKRRGRKSRRHRGGSPGVAANASEFVPEAQVNSGGEEAPVEETPTQAGGKRRRRRKGRKSKRGGSCGGSPLVGGRRKTRKQKGGKRKLNGYFKLMLDAKKREAASFKYDGKTYKRVKRGHLYVYKRA